MGEGDRGSIELHTDREFSALPEDSGFKFLLKRLQKENSALAAALKELDRAKDKKGSKKEIITEALVAAGKDWRDLGDMSKDQKEAFGHLLSYWNEPVNDRPKTEDQHKQEAKKFAEML